VARATTTDGTTTDKITDEASRESTEEFGDWCRNRNRKSECRRLAERNMTTMMLVVVVGVFRSLPVYSRPCYTCTLYIRYTCNPFISTFILFIIVYIYVLCQCTFW